MNTSTGREHRCLNSICPTELTLNEQDQVSGSRAAQGLIDRVLELKDKGTDQKTASFHIAGMRYSVLEATVYHLGIPRSDVRTMAEAIVEKVYAMESDVNVYIPYGLTLEMDEVTI
jgi:hypothetical protein